MHTVERGELQVQRLKEGDLRDVEEVDVVVDVVEVVDVGEVVVPVPESFMSRSRGSRSVPKPEG